MNSQVPEDFKRGTIENIIEINAKLILGIILFAAVIAFTIYIAKQFFSRNDEILSMANSVVLFWTGVVLIWYTWETSKLRNEAHRQVEAIQRQIDISQKQIEETQRQTEIQQRPFVALDIVYESQTTMYAAMYDVGVKNLGTGTAINIVVKDNTENTSEEMRVPYSFVHPVPILPPGERCPIEYERLSNSRRGLEPRIHGVFPFVFS